MSSTHESLRLLCPELVCKQFQCFARLSQRGLDDRHIHLSWGSWAFVEEDPLSFPTLASVVVLVVLDLA